jgi:hypothetical protein
MKPANIREVPETGRDRGLFLFSGSNTNPLILALDQSVT